VIGLVEMYVRNPESVHRNSMMRAMDTLDALYVKLRLYKEVQRDKIEAQIFARCYNIKL